MVGHILLYHPAVVKLRQLIDQGALGRILYCYSNRLNMGLIRTEENILWSFAPHDISVMLHLLGEEPISAEAEGQSYLTPGVVDVTLSRLRFRSGATGHIFVSWLHPSKEQKLVVVGSEQMAVFDDTAQQKLLLYPHRVDWASRTPKAVKAEAVAVELEKAEPLPRRVPPLPRLRGQPADAAERRPRRAARAEGARRLPAVAGRHRQPHHVGQTFLSAQNNVEARAANVCHEPAAASDYFAHESAYVDQPCTIGKGTKIWHFSHVMKNAKIGENCSVGQNVVIGSAAVIGNGVKIQNNVSIYDAVTIEDGVFCGPSMVFTNVINPAERDRPQERIPADADPARRHAGRQLDDRLRPHGRPLRLYRGRGGGRLERAGLRPDGRRARPTHRLDVPLRRLETPVRRRRPGRLFGLRSEIPPGRMTKW